MDVKSVLRLLIVNIRKKDMPRYTEATLLPNVRKQVENSESPVVCLATDYRAGWEIKPHSHPRHQLIYAIYGVMAVRTQQGHWVVPPTRGLWVPAGMTHAIRCIGEVQMRSMFVREDAAPKLSLECNAVGISALLRELIVSAAEVSYPYAANSRDGRLMRLVLDELRALPVLPLYLPMPTDPRILHICKSLERKLEDASTLSVWSQRLHIDVKTIQRLFVTETGMTFGRWRQQARLLRALELLASGWKVIDIALELGYDSPGAFSTMFKKQFGESPRNLL